MPLAAFQERYLEVTIWDEGGTFQENMFLGVCRIPLRNLSENYEINNWHVLEMK
jgi:hypothetical protein